MYNSIVVYKTPCIYGYTKSCKSSTCLFNHFRTELEFVTYRSQDPQWVENNQDLVYKYTDELVYGTPAVGTNFHGCVYYDAPISETEAVPVRCSYLRGCYYYDYYSQHSQHTQHSQYLQGNLCSNCGKSYSFNKA